MTDPNDHTKELERKVERLTKQVHDLTAERNALMQRKAERRDDASAAGLTWIGRVLLVFLTVGVLMAAAVIVQRNDLTVEQLSGVSSEFAAIGVDLKLIVCALLAGLALIAYLGRRPLLFAGFALLTVYCTYWFYFADRPEPVPMADATYFWIAAAILTAAYTLLALFCIHESKRSQRGRRRWALLALGNSVAFLPIIWLAVRQSRPDDEWLFRLAFAGLMTVLAALAETHGPQRNYVFQLFVAKAVLMINLSLGSLLDSAWLTLVLAAECVFLAQTFRQSGIVVFKPLNVIVLVFASAYGIFLSGHDGAFILADRSLPLNWLFGITTALLLLIAAVSYSHGEPGRSPSERRTSGHWFFADSMLDWTTDTVALMHAGGATFVIVGLAVLDLNDNPALPFLLAAAAAPFMAVAVTLRIPAIETAAMLLLTGAQAAFGFYYFMEPDAMTALDIYPFGLIGLIVGSFTFAWLWDQSVKHMGANLPFEHSSAIAAPYTGAALIAAAAVHEWVPVQWSGIVQQGIAVAFLAGFAKWRASGMRITAMTLVVSGALTFLAYAIATASSGEPGATVWPWLGAHLVIPIAAERLLRTLHRDPGADTLRTVAIVTACVTGMLGLYVWAPLSERAFWWLGIAGGASLCGFVFREGRYRWTSLVILIGAVVLAAGNTPGGVDRPDFFPFAVAAAVVAALIIVSWGYALRRQLVGGQRLPRLKRPSPDG